MPSHKITAIVGRPNVGKSTLFNALAGRRIAIVDDVAGTTRDRISAEISRDGLTIELTDTGGFESLRLNGRTGGAESQQIIWREIRKQINTALDEAGLIIFLTDIRTGVTGLDMEISKALRRLNKPVVLCVNKADNPNLETGLLDFCKLGWGAPFAVSAIQRRGLDEVWNKIREHFACLTPPLGGAVERQEGFTGSVEAPVIPACKQTHQNLTTGSGRPLSIAIAGKRNVGKSTLVNSLACEKRAIVSEIPGTTRDAIDVLFEQDGEKFIAIDTAGILKKKKLKDAVEIYSQQKTEAAIRRSDVVIFMIDAHDKISEVDKKIAQTIIDGYKPCVIAVNKWDLVKKNTLSGEYQEYLNTILPPLSFAPIVFISAKTGFNIQSIIKMSRELYIQSGMKITTPSLNKVADKIKAFLPVAHRGARTPKIYYVAQTGSWPPTITLMINNRSLFSKQAVRYVQQQLRQMLPVNEVPIKIILKNKKR